MASNGNEEEEGNYEFQVPPIYRGCKKERVERAEENLNLGYEAGYHSHRGKKLRKKHFDTGELAEMLRLVREEGFLQKDVAQRYRVKPALVASLFQNEKRQRNSLE